MVEFGTFSTFRGWVRVRVLGYGSGVRGRKVKSRDCALASDLVKAPAKAFSCVTAVRAACVSTWLGELGTHRPLTHKSYAYFAKL